MASDDPRHLVILAVDGIGLDQAAASWRHAALHPLQSVFPTTSAAAWLSSTTGLSVEEHAVPGVVFVMPGGGHPEYLFDYHGPLPTACGEEVRQTLFTDATALGYRAVAILGDLAVVACRWRDMLLTGAEIVPGETFFVDREGGYRRPDLGTFGERIDAVIAASLTGQSGPALVWCFIEVDKHIHHHGYDTFAAQVLAEIESVCLRQVEAGRLVIAYSDHGHVPTRNDGQLRTLVEQLAGRHDFAVGGAGRTRWLHLGSKAPPADDLVRVLRQRLPATVRVQSARDLIRAGTELSARVGDVFLTATGRDFLAPDGYEFDHGSWSPAEYAIPFASWQRPR